MVMAIDALESSDVYRADFTHARRRKTALIE
jgi:hypothetical protein